MARNSVLQTFIVLLLVAGAFEAKAADAGQLCDQYAADPSDPDRPAGITGVAQIAPSDAQRAVAACMEASSRTSAYRRFHYQLGRAYEASDREYTGNAVRAYRAAADAGSAAAMAALGEIYMSSDFAEAFRLLSVAANSGNARSMRHLGDMYRHGLGVPADREQALRWYRGAAALGERSSMNVLGEFGAASP